jgi:hypothetical protein
MREDSAGVGSSSRSKSCGKKKQELRQNGPRVCVIADVEQGEGFPDKKTGLRPSELVLVFEDGTKLGLGARVNRDGMIATYGNRTSGWVGQTIEVYFDPTVSNPFGGENGGVRLRRLGSMAAPEEYVSDLEQPAKGNGAERSVKLHPRASKKTADRDVDDVPF